MGTQQLPLTQVWVEVWQEACVLCAARGARFHAVTSRPTVRRKNTGVQGLLFFGALQPTRGTQQQWQHICGQRAQAQLF